MIDLEQELGLATIASTLDGAVRQGQVEAAIGTEACHLVVGIALRPIGNGPIDVKLLQVQRRDNEAGA